MASRTTAATTADLDTPNNDRRILSVIIVLGLVGAIIIACIIWYTIRLKRRSDRPMSSGPFQGTMLPPNHPAARISPFGARNFAPSFDHRPGEDMRIAYQRPDGAWLFADSRAPFAPVGVSDLEHSPVSASSSQFFPFSPPLSKKEKEALDSRKLGQEGCFEYEPVVPPPPAYQRHVREDASL